MGEQTKPKCPTCGATPDATTEDFQQWAKFDGTVHEIEYRCIVCRKASKASEWIKSAGEAAA